MEYRRSSREHGRRPIDALQKANYSTDSKLESGQHYAMSTVINKAEQVVRQIQNALAEARLTAN